MRMHRKKEGAKVEENQQVEEKKPQRKRKATTEEKHKGGEARDGSLIEGGRQKKIRRREEVLLEGPLVGTFADRINTLDGHLLERIEEKRKVKVRVASATLELNDQEHGLFQR